MSDKAASIARSAERNNDKLFPIFQKNLSSDNLAEFATAAEKLSGWLSRDKAYYTKARPMIIALMETARDTVRRHSGSQEAFHISRITDTVRPWAEAYVKILRAVVPFALLFSERTLQLRLRMLLQALCDNVDTFLSQQTLFSPSAATSPTASVAGTPGAPFTPSSASQSPVATIQPALPRLSPAASVFVDPANPPKLTEAQINAVLALAQAQNAFSPVAPSPAASSGPIIPPAAAPVPPLPGVNIPNPASVNPTPPPPDAEPAMPLEQSGKPKAKKRKTAIPIDLGFIEADLTWYEDMHGAKGAASANQGAAAAAPNTATNTPVVTEPAASTPNAPEVAKPPADTASTVATTPQEGLSVNREAAPLTKSRSPSVPLRETARSASASLPRTTSANGSPKPIVKEEPGPHSPVILAPSLTRRPTEAEASPLGEGSSSSPAKAASPLAGDALPSPLTTKKTKKRKRGPPGLKFLPMPVDERPPEAMAVDDVPGSGDALTSKRKSSTPSAPTPAAPTPDAPAPSAPTPPPPPPEATRIPDTRAASEPNTLPPASRDQAPDEPEATVESPVPMDLDSSDSNQSIPIITNGDILNGTNDNAEASTAAQSSTEVDAEMRDLPNGHATESATREASSPPKEPETQSTSFLPPPSSTRASSADAAPGTTLVPPQPTLNGSAPTTDTPTAMELIATEPSTVPEPATAPDNPDPSPFADTSARVLGMVRGASSSTPATEPVVLEFELSADELAQVARWNNSSKSPNDLSTSLCISLVSYPISQLQADSMESLEGPEDIAKCGRPAPWPQDGSAVAALNVEGGGQGGERFAIAPPFMTPVDNCIDLSARGLRAGANTLHLVQYRDLSERAFAVLAHRPTRAALAALQAARDREREWHTLAERLRRFERRAPRLFPASPLFPTALFANHS